MDMFFFRFLFIPIFFVFSFLIESPAAFANNSNLIESPAAFANNSNQMCPVCANNSKQRCPVCANNSKQLCDVYERTNNQWLVGIGGGATIRSLASSTQISNGTPVPAPYNNDIFSISTSDHNAAFNIFGGYQWNRCTFFIPYYNLSLQYEHQFDADITGKIQQYALPQFTNYEYTMGLNSDILSLVGKVGLIQYKCVIPYFSAGVGAAFNHLNNYSESPIYPVDPARISPNYGKFCKTNFAYTLGAGFDVICCKNTWVSFAYEYWNLGKVNSGSGTDSWSSTRLDFGTLKSNTLLAKITFLLG